jgi:hypothetical protein
VEDGNEVTATTTEFVFEWITSDVTLRLQDQHGVEIAGSRFTVGGFGFWGGEVLTGDTAVLPITDESVYPTLTGHFADGHDFAVIVQVAGTSHPSNLYRVDSAKEVTADTSELAFEWIQYDCPLEVRNANGQPVPGSSVTLPPNLGPAFPVNDPSVYPTISGNLVTGYPVTMSPGNVAPASATINFTVQASGELDPASFSISGNTYSLAFSCHHPPLAVDDAATTAQNSPVVIAVLANDSDPDGDALSVLASTQGAHGAVTLNADGTITYTPAPAFHGTDQFTYTLSDGHGGTDTAMVTVTVNQRVLGARIKVRQDNQNVESQGQMHVIVFSAPGFDATRANVSSVRFAGATPIASEFHDEDHDGLLDLVLKFWRQETQLRDIYTQLLIDDANADGVLDSTRQIAEVFLTGRTIEQDLFEGSDEVNLFLSGKALRDLLTSLAQQGLI